MPVVKDKSKSKSKTKDKAPKAKAKAKAKASAKVVSNIQNKIIIGEMPKKRRASTNKGRKVTKSSPQEQFRPSPIQLQVSSFQPPTPFVNTSTRLLDLQPNLNVLTERVNRLESSSLLRNAPQQAQQVQLEIPILEAQPIEEPYMEKMASDSVIDYYNELDARAAKKERQLIPDEIDVEPYRGRRPDMPKKVEPPLISREEPIKSEPMENPEELVASLEPSEETFQITPSKKSRKTDEQKLETKLRQEVRTARGRLDDAVSRFNNNSQLGRASNYDIKRRDDAEKNLAQAEKNLELFYTNR